MKAGGRIAVFSSSGQLGGAELSLMPVIARLAQDRELVVFVPGEGPLTEAVKELGVPVSHSLHLSRALSAISGSYGSRLRPQLAVSLAGHQLRTISALSSLRPAVVYSNGFRAQIASSLGARLVGARVIWHVRDFARPGLLGVLWRALARGATVILANSSATGRQPALRHVRDRVRVVPNGVDLESFLQRASEPRGPLTIGMVGHLTPWKGHARFLHLLGDLRKEYPDLRGAIAGSAIYETENHARYPQSLLALQAELGLLDACEVQEVPHEGMPEWLGELTLLVHCPERPEPFGRSLIEAMAVGVPVVTTGDGGAGEVVAGAGAVASGGGPRLRDLVSELLRDAARREQMARAGRERVMRHFDQGMYAERVVTELLAG